MKKLIFFPALLITAYCNAQISTSYSAWLNTMTELQTKDSIAIKIPTATITEENPLLIKQFIFPLFSDESSQSKPQSYHIVGKITSNYDYDIILLYISKIYSDSTAIKKIYLNTFSKLGQLLHSQAVASSMMFKDIKSNTSAIYFKHGEIEVYGERFFQNELTSYTTRYSINNHGIVYNPTK